VWTVRRSNATPPARGREDAAGRGGQEGQDSGADQAEAVTPAGGASARLLLTVIPRSGGDAQKEQQQQEQQQQQQSAENGSACRGAVGR
jgi:hypothetical protein